MFTRRFVLILVVLSLLVLLVQACGGDNEDENTATPVKTPVATATSTATTPTPTPTPGNNKPVKIGVLNSWSGAAAMSGMFYIDPIIKVIEKQVEDMGGILGGRPVEFIKYDNAGEVAKAAAGAQKLIGQDKVSLVTLGGVSGAEAAVIANVCEEEKVLFVSILPLEDIAERKYMVECSISLQAVDDDAKRLYSEVLTPKPKTVGIMSLDTAEERAMITTFKQSMKAVGIDVIYEEYLGLGVSDFSPYLTKVKYKHPDSLFINTSSEHFLAIAKQIMALGGWDGIQVTSFGNALGAKKMPGAEGWIVVSPWDSAKNDPESLKFKEYYAAVNGGKIPDPNHVYVYNTLWTAIHAIELAGTDDPVAIAKAARSGNLKFDTPMGRAHFGTDGIPDLRHMYVQIQKGGGTVPYPK